MSGRLVRTLAVSAAVITLAACSKAKDGSIPFDAALNSGIIGGQVATGSEDFAKSTVLLYDKQIGAICTASIISDKLLITAAHCVSSAPQFLVVVFGTDADSTDIVGRRVIATATTVVWTARQNQILNNGDMALVAFYGGLPAGYVPARLLGDASKLTNGETVTLAGYGTANGVTGEGAGRLRYVDTTIEKVDYSASEFLFEQSHGKGACHGDSGGPAYVTVDGKKLLIGVTSRGVNDPQNHCDVSSAYTSIPAYGPWIIKTAKELTAKVNSFKPPVSVKPQDPTTKPQAPQSPVANKPKTPRGPRAA